MDFDITSSLHGDVLIVTFTGQSTRKNVHAMIKRYFEIVLGSGMKKVLADIRLLKGRLSVVETYDLVRNLPVKPTPANINTAILEMKERRGYANFLETTSANAGVRFRCFSIERKPSHGSILHKAPHSRVGDQVVASEYGQFPRVPSVALVGGPSEARTSRAFRFL